MLNKEKYKDEILELLLDYSTVAICNGKICDCDKIDDCRECDFSHMYDGEDCNTALRKWADSEYEEPEIDWERVPVDTPVLVVNYEDETNWNRRYFYKYHDPKKNNRPFEVFIDGGTSWSSGLNETTIYKYCKLAREEDIKRYRKR